jgi:hypothetical protein
MQFAVAAEYYKVLKKLNNRRSSTANAPESRFCFCLKFRPSVCYFFKHNLWPDLPNAAFLRVYPAVIFAVYIEVNSAVGCTDLGSSAGAGRKRLKGSKLRLLKLLELLESRFDGNLLL